jgi:type VI secretion system secreted protein Hcp
MTKTDCFLKLAGIDGESTDAEFPKNIHLLAWSWGAATDVTPISYASGSAVGRAAFDRFHFLCRTNLASASLFNHFTSGRHIASAVLHCRRAGDNPQVFLKIVATDCVIQDMSTGGHGLDDEDALPTESYTLDYARIQYSYGKTDSKGKVGALDQKMGYDLRLKQRV